MSNSPIVKTNGPKGDPGPEGPQGEAATLNVGTTTTLPPGSDATVVNVGDENDAIFDFGIPRGEPGSGGVPDPAPLNNTLRGNGTSWESSAGLQNNTSKVSTNIPIVIGSHATSPGIYQCLVDGNLGVTGSGNFQDIVTLNQINEQNIVSATMTVTEPITQPNQLATKAYVDAQSGGGFWEDAGSGNIQNNNSSGTVIIQDGLFAGPCLVTSLAITAAQNPSGGNVVRWDYWNSNSAKASTTITAGAGLTGGGSLAANRTIAVDSTVVRTTGAQTVSSKTLNSCSLSGTFNISGISTSTSAFVCSYTGSGSNVIMHRGPLVPTSFQMREALLGIASLAGVPAAQVEALLSVNNLSAAAVGGTP